MKFGIGGVNKNIKSGLIGIGGVNKNIKEVYVGIGGVNKLVWQKPSVFSPADIPNLKMWLDANTENSIIKDINNRVSQWSDLSGNNNHATQTVLTKQPIYVADGFNNGKPCIRGVASRSDHLINPNINVGINGTTGATIFTVYNHYLASTGGAYALSDNLTSVNRGFALFTWNGTAYSKGPLGFSDITFKYTINTNMITSQRWGSNAETIDRHKFWHYGVLQGANNPVWDTRLYNKFIIFALTSNNYPTNSDIAEYIIFNRALSDADRQSIENYLMSKWGLV